MHDCKFCVGTGRVGCGLACSLTITERCHVCRGSGKLVNEYPKDSVVYVIDTGDEVLMAKWRLYDFEEVNPFGEQPSNPRKFVPANLRGWG